MKNFDLNTPCIKCGYCLDHASIDYQIGIFSEELQQSVSTTVIGSPPDDYLLRTCRRCGYMWAEKAIDS